MPEFITAGIKRFRIGFALAAVFGWLLSFPMFGRLLMETAGDRALILGLTFVLSHAFGLLILPVLTGGGAGMVRGAGVLAALLTILYLFVHGNFVVDLLIFAVTGVAGAYLVLAWVTEFMMVKTPLLSLAVAMAGANLFVAVVNVPRGLSMGAAFVLVAVLVLTGTGFIRSNREELLNKPQVPDRDSLGFVKALATFVVAIYFVGGIWYRNVIMQMSPVPGWDAAIVAIVCAASIVLLAFFALRSQPGNLALYSLSALGVGLLLSLAQVEGLVPGVVYNFALTFGLAAADLFFWYALWVLGRLYGGRRVFGIGLGFSLLLIAFTLMISAAGWFGGSAAVLYIVALAFLFLTIPVIFRYPFQLPDLSGRVEAAAGVEAVLTPPEILTPTEQQVYTLLMQGATDAQIAETMVISQHTVKFHTRNTLRKLGVKNRKELLSRSLVKIKL